VTSVPVISVVGSLNVDHTFRVSRFPEPGETLTALGAEMSFGGKGANQAVAAARAGGKVRMIGCLGNDERGREYRARLEAEEIENSGVLTVETSTGAAFITVDRKGENTIVVDPGANHALTPKMLEDSASRIEESAVTLLQLECPPEVVAAAAVLTRAAGRKVVLNPSPWQPEAMAGDIPVDVLIVNEREAESLPGGPEGFCSRMGCEAVIVTRGASPTRIVSRGGSSEVSPPKVSPVDTVGAGDAFAGVFALAYARGLGLGEAVRMANAAAALATLKRGAQEAIPRGREIEAMLSREG